MSNRERRIAEYITVLVLLATCTIAIVLATLHPALQN